jgi:hypothetical protein
MSLDYVIFASKWATLRRADSNQSILGTIGLLLTLAAPLAARSRYYRHQRHQHCRHQRRTNTAAASATNTATSVAVTTCGVTFIVRNME